MVCDIAAVSDKSPENERAVRLLLGAIRTLPKEDQDAVLALLLQGLTGSKTWELEVRNHSERERIAVAALGSIRMRPGRLTIHQAATMWESDAKVVPIRFPAKTHEQFKAWCEEHNFPMAAVVRGLVERFLESQQLP